MLSLNAICDAFPTFRASNVIIRACWSQVLGLNSVLPSVKHVHMPTVQYILDLRSLCSAFFMVCLYCFQLPQCSWWNSIKCYIVDIIVWLPAGKGWNFSVNMYVVTDGIVLSVAFRLGKKRKEKSEVQLDVNRLPVSPPVLHQVTPLLCGVVCACVPMYLSDLLSSTSAFLSCSLLTSTHLLCCFTFTSLQQIIIFIKKPAVDYSREVRNWAPQKQPLK